MSRTTAELEATYRFGAGWRLTVRGRAHVDPVQRLGYPRNVWLDPREVILGTKIKAVNLRLGLQQVVWGQADGLRVLDVINPLDYREFILEEFLDSRRPLWGARADWSLGKGSLEGVWIPYFAPGRTAGPDNEFGIGTEEGLRLADGVLGNRFPRQISFRLDPARRPPYRLGSSQAALRYSRSVGRWDLTGDYFYGWEDTATPYLRDESGLALLLDPRITVEPRYDRRQVAGATAVTTAGPLVLRMEAAWNPRKAAALSAFPPHSGWGKFGQFLGVAGVDYTPASWIWISGQYFLQMTAAPQRVLTAPRNDHLISVYLRTQFFRDRLRPELFVLTGLNQRQYMIRPRIARSFNDHWIGSVGADFLGGATTTAFGIFTSRDRVVLELKWMH